jgi:anti-sigma regulatory factor (Ser/Thr protein kinase)
VLGRIVSGRRILADERKQRLTIRNDLVELPKMGLWLSALAKEWGLPAKTVFSADLVIGEAVTNIISYAYRDDGPRYIDIELVHAGTSLRIEIIDDGWAFNPLERPPIAVGTDLENASISGRGIHLIKSYSDEQHYSFISDHNHLKLTLKNQP